MLPFGFFFAFFAVNAFAASLSSLVNHNNEKPTAISADQRSFYQRVARFETYVYCTNLQTGQNVTDNADGNDNDFQLFAVLGNGRTVQRALVAHSHSPDLGIIVGFQGTNLSEVKSILNDLLFINLLPTSRLAFLQQYTSVPVLIAAGFQLAFGQTADDIIERIKAAQILFPNSKVTIVGHSLGASIALLQAAYVYHKLGITPQVVLFGLPRTGNLGFARAIDRILPGQVHITNYHDIIPRLPPRALGYRHPSGEIWIRSSDGNDVVACPGEENSNCALSVGLTDMNLDLYKDHSGPYFGVYLDCPTALKANTTSQPSAKND